MAILVSAPELVAPVSGNSIPPPRRTFQTEAGCSEPKRWRSMSSADADKVHRSVENPYSPAALSIILSSPRPLLGTQEFRSSRTGLCRRASGPRVLTSVCHRLTGCRRAFHLPGDFSHPKTIVQERHRTAAAYLQGGGLPCGLMHERLSSFRYLDNGQ